MGRYCPWLAPPASRSWNRRADIVGAPMPARSRREPLACPGGVRKHDEERSDGEGGTVGSVYAKLWAGRWNRACPGGSRVPSPTAAPPAACSEGGIWLGRRQGRGNPSQLPRAMPISYAISDTSAAHRVASKASAHPCPHPAIASSSCRRSRSTRRTAPPRRFGVTGAGIVTRRKVPAWRSSSTTSSESER
jgi:hypothetical protein